MTAEINQNWKSTPLEFEGDSPEAHTTREKRSIFQEDGTTSVLLDALEYARLREYSGWDYGDGMSSKLRQRLPFENKWVNIAFQESIKRAPVNIRPWLLVEQRRNFKGTALFALANLNVARLKQCWNIREDDTETEYHFEAIELLDWLVDNQSDGYSGFCGGHKHKIQFLDGQGHPNDPDVVSTSFAVKALLSGSEYDSSYGELAKTSFDFLVEDLCYREAEVGAKVDYYMNEPDDCYTYNSAALGARLLLDLYDYFGEDDLRERATKILDYLDVKQTSKGGWMYREPASASHLSMDSFHNGYIIEALLRHRHVTGTRRYDDTLAGGLKFYRSLFESNGAPRRNESEAYPRDIHDCAQGIIIFSYLGEFEFAKKIIDWVVDNLYAGGGQFYYQKRRFYTKQITLMRWCQAWMAYAISEYLKQKATVLDETATL